MEAPILNTRSDSSNGVAPAGCDNDCSMTDQFETLAVHAGADPDPLTGGVSPAIEMSTTFKQDAVGETRGGFEYGRSDNPTRRALESAIAALEGGTRGFAYASGLAATQNLLYL